MAFQLQKSGPGSTTWADPADLSTTVRLKQTSSPKSVSGVSMTNHRSEIIINSKPAATAGLVDFVDSLSVRLTTSGSQHTKAELLDIIGLLTTTVESWAATNWTVGFEPNIVPVNPV